jgi:AraC-like DNA-binding protein
MAILLYLPFMISLQQYHPVSLAPIVKSFWCLQFTGNEKGVYHENIIPDGHHEIIFHYNDNCAKRSTAGNSWIIEPTAFFAGQTSQSYSLELNNECLIYGIRFYPHTLHALFAFPANHTTDKLLCIEEIKKSKSLINCLSADVQQTFHRFEKLLLKMAGNVDLSSNRFRYIDYSINEIIKKKGNIKIDSLIKQAGVSAKYYDTLFNRFVGITPKSFCNIIKLNHFISYRNNFPEKSLTGCAYEAGFFDQSHLIRLFRSVTGQAPSAWFHQSNFINNHFIEL